MASAKIEIDQDEPCQKCGQMGAAPGGFCISCATDAVLDDGQRLIDEALVSVWDQVKRLMALHSSQIRMAYHKADEGKLSIGMTAEMSPSEEVMNTLKVRVKINFVESRIKDESMERVSLQVKLPIGGSRLAPPSYLSRLSLALSQLRSVSKPSRYKGL